MIRRLVKRMLMIWQVFCRRDCSPKIVFYHDVGTCYTSMGTPSALFWKHMSNLGPHGVAFDDGFRGVWDERERFREKGIRPTMFIAIRLVGHPGYLTWDEIRTLQNEYGFNFECHTWSHQTLAGSMIGESPIEKRSDAWFQRELVASKAELERQLGQKVTALCFPVGNFSDEVIAKCKSAGYTKVYASYPGNVSTEYIQPRNLVQDFDVFDFKLVLKGGLMAFYQRYYKVHKIINE